MGTVSIHISIIHRDFAKYGISMYVSNKNESMENKEERKRMRESEEAYHIHFIYR